VSEPAKAEEVTVDPALVAEIEAQVEDLMASHPIPGMAISVVKDGQVVYSDGFGVAEYGSERAMTPQTLFPVASLAKTFTAAAIMQLEEQGKLDLDAPVTDYLPYFQMTDERHQDITVRHLLAHISGLAEASSFEYPRFETNAQALEDVVRSEAPSELLGTPGEATFEYSALNYDIAGDIIAKLSEEPYEAHMKRNILEPLGMQDSTFLYTEADPSSFSAMHWLDQNQDMVVSDWVSFDQVHSPAEALVSNIDDLSKWALLHLNRGELEGRRILEEDSFETLWTPHAIIPWGWDEPWEEYGLGWAVADVDGHRVVFWGGSNYGGNTELFLAPDDDLAIVTLVNFTEERSFFPPYYAFDLGYSVLLSLLGIGAE
jgi:CubicO group peptidase (beta-lactamase class C family)